MLIEFDLEFHLETFNNFASLETNQFQIVKVAPYVLKLELKTKNSSPTLGLMGLVHGNEILGLPILIKILKEIKQGELVPQSDIYFGLGNIPAASKNLRFIESDLNRSFQLPLHSNPEQLRAKELEEKMLSHCDYLIDLHQTQEPAQSSFFIFQYTSQKCLDFLRKINTGIPVIVQKENIGSDAGLTTDEFVRGRGGFGTTLELGQIGHAEEYFMQGLQICRNVISIMQQVSKSEMRTEFPLPFKLYKLSDRFKIEESNIRLKKGYRNFEKIEAGQVVAEVQTEVGKNEIKSDKSGFMLFPRYKGPIDKGQELFFLCQEIKPEDLNQ
jgi:succinylglutamate desuccinylase